MTQIRRSGITTRYRGVEYRSRLEAKWAWFFDSIGWRFEYEPFDAAGYIPDFVVLGDDPFLVEVKPAANLTDLAGPLDHARKRTLDQWSHDIIAVGVSPFLGTGTYWPQFTVLGLLDAAEDWGAGSHDEALWNECGKCGQQSFRAADGWFKSRICGHHDGDHYVNDPLDFRELEAKWRYASDRVKWRP